MIKTITAPLYFVRSGDVNRRDGRLWSAGNSGYGRPSTPYLERASVLKAYSLAFDDETTNPLANGGNRWGGIPIRCLARY